MTNEILNIIHQRRSIGNLYFPMPNDAELKVVLQATMVAPDHNKLNW